MAFVVAVTGCCFAGSVGLPGARAVAETSGGNGDVHTREFMIGIFWAPPVEHTNDRQYDYLKEAHINVIPCIHPSLEGRVAIQRKILDLAHARGMKVMVRDPERHSDARAVTADFKEHPALWGYYLKDEPAKGEFMKYGRMIRDFLEHDPHHIPFVNMLPAGASPLRMR